MISNPLWSEKSREWVGLDVNIVQGMEEDQGSSMSDTGEVSEGDGIYQNADKQDDENSKSLGAELQENTGIEQPFTSEEELSESEDSVVQNPLEIVDRNKEILISDDETRNRRKNLPDPDLAHVIVDEDVDFDQFGVPPPDLPVIGSSDHEQRGGIGSPNAEKGASESVESMKPEDQITDLAAGNGYEQDMKNLEDGPVKSSVKDTGVKGQLQIEQDPEPDAHPKPADNEEHVVHKDLDDDPAAGKNGTSELQEPENLKSDNIGDTSSESALRSSTTETEVGISAQEETQKRTENLYQLTQEQATQLEDIRHRLGSHWLTLIHTAALRSSTTETEEEGISAQEEIQKRTESLYQLTQEQATQLEDIRHQVELSHAQLEEQSRIHKDLKRTLEAERDERFKNEVKLMVLHEILLNTEENLKNLSDQVQVLEVQLQEQINSRNKLENGLQQERKEKAKYITQLKEQTRLHEELANTLEEERDGRLNSDAGLAVLRELFTSSEENTNDLRNQVDSLVLQLQQETELRSSLEEKLDWERKERTQHMTKIEEQAKIYEELSVKSQEERAERIKSETYVKELGENIVIKEENLKDLHTQVVSLTAQLQEHKDLRRELEGKWDHERKRGMEDAVTLPVSSMSWSEEKLEFEKLLDEQKTLLANQVQEVEKLKNAAEMKVGLLNHQAQNLKVLTDIAETMGYAFNAKERVIKQALWTTFQALCLGVGLMSFIVAYRDLLRSSLLPT